MNANTLSKKKIVIDTTNINFIDYVETLIEKGIPIIFTDDAGLTHDDFNKIQGEIAIVHENNCSYIIFTGDKSTIEVYEDNPDLCSLIKLCNEFDSGGIDVFVELNKVWVPMGMINDDEKSKKIYADIFKKNNIEMKFIKTRDCCGENINYENVMDILSLDQK